jgi:hypothetical protein
MYSMRIPAVLAALSLALIPLGAAALEAPDTLRANWGVLVESLLNPALGGNVSSPSVNFNLGAGVDLAFSPGSRFSFEPSADIYFYNSEVYGGQPVPTDETFSSTFTIGALLNAPVMYSVPINSKVVFSAGAGLCLDLRFALPSGGLAPDAASQSNTYYWGEGRFLTPSTTLRVEYALTDRLGCGISGRVLWPIYNLWTGEGYGFFDQGKYLLDVVLRYRLKPAPAASPAPATAP